MVGVTGGNGDMTVNSNTATATASDSNGNVNRTGTPGLSTTYDSLERQLRSMSLQSNLNKLDTSLTNTNPTFGTPTDIATPSAVYGSTIRNHRTLLRENAPLSRSSTLIETMNVQQSPIGQQTQFATSTMGTQPQQPQQQAGPVPQRNGSLFNYLMGSSHTPVQQQQQQQQQQPNPLEMNHQGLLGGLRTNGDVASIFNSPGSALTTHTPVSATTPVQPIVSSPFNPTVMGPGANNYMPVIVTSQWRYIDHQGQIQGPFQTPNMSMWYINNYFQPSLQISRVGTSFEPFGINDKFITLSELISRVNNSADPFTAFDMLVSTLANDMLMANLRENGLQQQEQQMQMQQPQMQDKDANNGSGNPAMDAKGPVTSVPKETVKVPETSVPSTTGNVASTGGQNEQKVVDQRDRVKIINEERKDRVPTADITASGDYTLDELFQMEFDDGSYYHEIIVPVPVNRKLVRKIDPSTVIEEENVDPMLLDNRYLKSRESVEYSERMKEIAQLKAAKEAERKEAERLEQERLAARRKQDMLREEELRRKEKAELMAKKLLQEQERAEMEKKKREEMKILKQQQQQQKKLQKKQKQQQQQQQEEKLNNDNGKDSVGTVMGEEARAEHPDEVSPTDSSAADGEKSAAKGPTLISTPAPWATQQRPVKSIPLLEMKRQEDLKQRKLEEERERKARANLLKLNDQLLKEEREKQKMRSILTWAEKSPTTAVPVSLDLKSQLKKEKERPHSPAGSGRSTTPSPLSSEPLRGDATPSFIEEQMRIWEQVQRANKSKRQAEASNQWTTVKSKSSSSSSKTKGKSITQQQQQQPTKQIGSSTSIPALKNRPLATPLLTTPKSKGTVTNPSLTASAPSYPGNASISLRQEFIKWCKSQLKLNPGISVTSVLEVLLSLPSGSESREIIADTIYSNSSTMDGRRFATEFIKRRTECEKKVKDPLSWNAVLAMPEGTDDDWEFQVVGKRKGKKHQN